MADVARGSVLLTPKFDGLTASITRQLGGAFKSVDGIASKAGASASSSMGAGFLRTGGIIGAASAVTSKAFDAISASMGSAITRVDTMANFPKVMQNLGYSSEDARRSISRMSEAIDGMPTSLDSITGMVQQLAPLTGGMDEATSIGIAFNNALLAGGASAFDVSRAMQQYTQMLSKGKPELQDWKTLQEVMPGQLNQIAQALLGPTAKGMDLYNALKKGNVSMDDFNAAMVRLSSEGVNGFASFEEQARTATGGIGTAMTNVQNRIAKGMASILDAIGQTNISGAINAFSSKFSKIADVAVMGIEMAKLAFSDPDAFATKGAEMVESVSAGARSAIPALATMGLDALQRLASGFRTGLPQLAQAGGQVVLGIVQGLVASLPSLIEKGPQIVSDIANGISAAAEVLSGVALQIIVVLAQGIVSAIPVLVSNIPQILQAVWDAFTAYNWLALGGTLVNGIGSGIATFGSQIPTKLKGFFDQAVNHGGKFVADMASKGLQAGSNFLLNIAANISQLPGRFAAWLSEMILRAASFVGSLGAKASQAGQGFLAGIQGGFNAAVSFVASIPGRIMGAIGNLGNLLVGAGRSLINGLKRGISDAIGGVISMVSGAVGKIRAFFPFSPAKTGPFSGHGYTTWSGRALITDFGESVRKYAPAAASMVEDAVAGVRDAATVAPISFTAAKVPDPYGAAQPQVGGGPSAMDVLLAILEELRLFRESIGDIIEDRTPVEGERSFGRRVRAVMAGV